MPPSPCGSRSNPASPETVIAQSILAWIVAIPMLGFATGCRSMLPIACVCWLAWHGSLDVEGTWAFWAAHGISAAIFAVLAIGELIGDKLPFTPDRTGWFPLTGRIVFGGLVGAICATALYGSIAEGAILGAIAAIAGTFLGFQARTSLTRRQGWPDLPAALLEDAVVLGMTVAALRIVTS